MRTPIDRTLVGLACLLLLLTSGAPRAEPAAAHPFRVATPEPEQLFSGTLKQQLGSALVLAEGEDAVTADRALSAVIAHARFAKLPRSSRHLALSNAAWVALRLEQLARARDLYLAATGADPKDANDWFRLSLIEGDLGNYESATAYALHLLDQWPQTLEELPDRHIGSLVAGADPASLRRLELLQTLFDAQWTGNGLDASHFWYELALMQVERGQVQAASATIARISRPDELIRLRADRRFDALIDRDEPRFDVARAAHARADDLRVKAMLEPQRLDLLLELSYAMLAIGGHTEVLAMTEAALAVIATEPAEASPFDSLDDQVWLMNNRAIALRRLGRIDEALAQLEHARHLSGNGGANVSQALNMGQFYCSLGRPKDALQAVAGVGHMSGYGRMVQASVQLCASHRSGDDAGAGHALAYLREHRDDSQIQLLEALLELARIDEAANTLIGLIDSPRERAGSLAWVQDLRRPAPLPGNRALAARRIALVARADVQAAVHRVGRIERHEIYDSARTD